jgi:ubiquinone biosynthesis protein
MDALLGWNLVISLLAILFVAWLSGRLLGVSRSLPATVLAGLTGWLAALALSLAIARGDTSAAGFTRNLWVFAIVFTMSSMVWIELLAKPGALARAQSSLVRLPRPIRAVRRSGQRIGRYAQITRIAVKYGFGPALGLGRGREEDEVAPTAPAARRLRLALEECGGMFVKLGQLLSTRADLLPESVTAELARLQDRVAPAPPGAVRELLEAELGRPVDQVFLEFDWEPIAAASIGQAYRAKLPGGEPVIVKVQRPGIAAAVERDLLVLAELAQVVESRTSWGAEYHVTELTNEFADRLREELDFRLEARNAIEIAANLDGMPRVHIPKVHEELSTARVLVLEWLDGVSVREVERIDRLGLERPALADTLLRCAMQQMLVDGRFHADPHPGNVLVLEGGRLGLIDFGATGRLDPLQQASMRGMLVAVQRRDASLLRQAVLGGRHPAPPLRGRAARARPRPLHGQAPLQRRRAQRGHVQRPVAAVLHLRDQPASRVLHLLPRPGDPGGNPQYAVPGLPGHPGGRGAGGGVGEGAPGPEQPGGAGPQRAGEPRPAAATRPQARRPHRRRRRARRPADAGEPVLR